MKRKPHHHEKSEEEITQDDLEEGLAVIYGEERDDLHTMTRGGSRLTRWLVRAVIALAIITPLAFLGYFIYIRYIAVENDLEPLVMGFDVASELKSGEEATIVLNYGNGTTVPIASLSIDVNLPSTFQVTSMSPEPTNAEDLVWDLGTIPTYTDSQITVTGVWIAEAPSTTTLQAIAQYRPSNFNSLFSDIATTDVTTLGSALTVEMTGPTTASPGQALSYTAIVKNTGTQTLKDAQLALEMPEGFFISDSDPEIAAGEPAEWIFAELPPAFEQAVTFTGSFASDVSGAKTLDAVLGMLDDKRVLLQSTSTASIDVTGSSLQLDLVANGNTGNVTADPGSLLRLSLRVQNTGEAALSGVSALVDFLADERLPLEWSEGDWDGGRLTSAGVVFDAATIGDLAPGGRKLFNISVPVKDDVDGYASEFTVVLGATQGSVTVKATPVIVDLNSDATLSAVGRYYDESGAPLGSGPLPPEVQETTSYRILWTIANGLHSLEDVTVSATLPEDVHWDSFSTADLGTIAFDEGTRVVRWTIASLPDDVQQIEANFSISITPEPTDAGAYMDLLRTTAMRATDAETGASLERSAEEITTEIPQDTYAEGEGRVTDD